MISQKVQSVQSKIIQAILPLALVAFGFSLRDIYDKWKAMRMERTGKTGGYTAC